MGGVELSKSYAARLDKELEQYYESATKHNVRKSMFAGFQTPVALFACLLFACLLSCVFDKLGLRTLSNLFNFFMMIVFVIAAVWVYTKTTGNYARVGAEIDGIVSTICKVCLASNIGYL